MQLDIRSFGLECGPLALALLHAVFAKDALTGSDLEADRYLVEGLGNRDQFNRTARPAACCLGCGNAGTHLVQPLFEFHRRPRFAWRFPIAVKIACSLAKGQGPKSGAG